MGLKRLLRTRRAEKNDAADFDEARQGQGAGHGQEHGRPHCDPGRRRVRQRGVEETQVDQPFADEAVERRQARDGHRAQREETRRPGHGAPEPPESTHLARPRRVQHGTGAEEEQPLEERVVPHVEQRPRERQSAPGRAAVLDRHQREAETDQDDADVLDAVIGEQPLQVMLAESEGDAQHGAHDTEGGDHRAGTRGRREPTREAHQSVDGHLEGHAGEHGGDVAGRVGVGRRQPDVQREHAGLEAEAEQRQPEQGSEIALLPQWAEVPATGASGEQREERQQRQRGQVRRREIEPTRRAHFLGGAIERDQEIGADREQLPRDQEVQAVGGQDEEHQGRHQHAPPHAPGAHGARVFCRGPVLAPVHGGDGADEAGHDEEERAHAVESEVQRLSTQRPLAAPLPVGGAAQDGDGGHRPDQQAEHGRPEPDARSKPGGQQAHEQQGSGRRQQGCNAHVLTDRVWIPPSPG